MYSVFAGGHGGAVSVCAPTPTARRATIARWVLVFLLFLLIPCRGATAAIQMFDWDVWDPLSPPANIIPAPFLTDSNYAMVDANLAMYPPGSTLAVKVVGPLNSAGAKAIFDKYHISYVFMDFEGSNALANATTTKSMIAHSESSASAWMGNFALTPYYPDMTRPSGYPSFGKQDYKHSGLNMANEELYPGQPSFRNPLSGDSTAPNVRSALFAMPITRLSGVSSSLSGSDLHIPWVARFNNMGNAALDSDGDPNHGTYSPYEFVSNAANPADGQLLSRGDFSAMVLHYRMRGATTLHLFEPGVVGYTVEEQQQDALGGWTLSAADSVFASPSAKLATLSTTIKLDGASTSLEDAGVVWSGVYDDVTQDKLVVLISNLDASSHHVALGSIDGKSVYNLSSLDDFAIDPGTHHLLTFALQKINKKSIWQLTGDTEVFLDHDRNGIGIPEPTGAALMTLVGLPFLWFRRRRRVGVYCGRRRA